MAYSPYMTCFPIPSDQFHGSQPQLLSKKNPVDSFQVGIGCIHLPHWLYHLPSPQLEPLFHMAKENGNPARWKPQSLPLYLDASASSLIFHLILMVSHLHLFFAQAVWYQRHGAVLQIQGGTVSHRHDHIITDKALSIFQITQSLQIIFCPLGQRRKRQGSFLSR